ncbi:hypothetical protein NC651_021475 [Populus alba x Populus x berolinensis]|nr:hypothetical protein NC651_021475 [Populus alba x Populus x berolinensis]
MKLQKRTRALGKTDVKGSGFQDAPEEDEENEVEDPEWRTKKRLIFYKRKAKGRSCKSLYGDQENYFHQDCRSEKKCVTGGLRQSICMLAMDQALIIPAIRGNFQWLHRELENRGYAMMRRSASIWQMTNRAKRGKGRVAGSSLF